MKRAILTFAIFALLAAAGGCGADNPSVTIANAMGAWDIHCVYISPAHSDEWGDDLLGEDEILEHGQKFTTGVEAGTYDIRIVDEDQDTYTRRAVEITEQGYSWEVSMADMD